MREKNNANVGPAVRLFALFVLFPKWQSVNPSGDASIPSTTAGS